ncbi:unnamed protein product [Absidia cylindrospora]
MDKWQGSFAQSQLEKFGWESKNWNGRTKHITVSKKNDKKGVGVGQDQWEFAWWDHLYNKSASEVTVEKDDQAQIKVSNKNKKSKSEIRRSATGIISTERPTGKTITAASTTTTTTTTTTTSMASMANAMNNEEDEGPSATMDSMVKDLHVNMAQRIAAGALYGGFVKSSTATVYDPSTPNTPTETSASSGTNDSEEEDELKDYSIKMTDAELFAACEGRTARKGGRGLVEQKGKFARVMQEYLHKNDDDDEAEDHSKKRKLGDDGDDKKKTKKAKKDKKDKKVKKDKKDKKEKKGKKEKKTKKKDKNTDA